jgi:hypothetical protein
MNTTPPIREPWERRNYGSEEAKKAMETYMRRLKESNQLAHPKRLKTSRENRVRAGRMGKN